MKMKLLEILERIGVKSWWIKERLDSPALLILQRDATETGMVSWNSSWRLYQVTTRQTEFKIQKPPQIKGPFLKFPFHLHNSFMLQNDKK